MQMNQMLTAQNERQATLLEQQAAQIQNLTFRMVELLQWIEELTHKMNSRNNFVHPSSGGYSKSASESQRKSTAASPAA